MSIRQVGFQSKLRAFFQFVIVAFFSKPIFSCVINLLLTELNRDSTGTKPTFSLFLCTLSKPRVDILPVRPSYFVNKIQCCRQTKNTIDISCCYIAKLSLNKMSTVIGWFLVTCLWSNSNVSRPGYNCAVVARTPSCVFLLYDCSRESLAI